VTGAPPHSVWEGRSAAWSRSTTYDGGEQISIWGRRRSRSRMWGRALRWPAVTWQEVGEGVADDRLPVIWGSTRSRERERMGGWEEVNGEHKDGKIGPTTWPRSWLAWWGPSPTSWVQSSQTSAPRTRLDLKMPTYTP
jgi:hypothetical protein